MAAPFTPRPEDEIPICDECLRASCWQGHDLCRGARDAGTTYMTRAELEALKLEDASFLKTDLQQGANLI